MSFVLALLLWSSTFKDGATVPFTMVAARCGGGNVSPQLSWSQVPPGTRSFALVVQDLDASAPGGFYHWVVYDIPPSQKVIPAGAGLGTGQSGRNTPGSMGYFGPCPPPGKAHRYQFTLYALDERRAGNGPPMSAPELAQRMRGHILGQATITGLWSATSPR